jgi:hypothetical protein
LPFQSFEEFLALNSLSISSDKDLQRHISSYFDQREEKKQKASMGLFRLMDSLL